MFKPNVYCCTGCEYGDRASWCSTPSSEGCYDNEETCCGTCKKYETSIPSCEYGDRASWCSTISANACHLNGDTCCRSCADQQSVTIAAPAPAPTAAPAPAPTAAPEPAIRATGTNLDSQGRVCYDRTNWCPTVSPWNCYTTWMNDACCGTCKKYVTSVPNCKYGDRWYGCDKLLVYPRKCYMYENECCSWCAQHETGNATCKYGDKVRECHTGHCLRWADDCCGTCG
ncbi:hypothetical protein V1264_012300 [Littorina saxatilis]|uniref:Uncharacterized protein n=1 Tax=Littorina saxatilis TaxID=31220 RepID=A0AAN9BWW2_9CAEN